MRLASTGLAKGKEHCREALEALREHGWHVDRCIDVRLCRCCAQAAVERVGSPLICVETACCSAFGGDVDLRQA